MGEERCKSFRVACGLREERILSPLLFSLYINTLVTKLKEAEVGVRRGKKLILVLLYADDAVIFADGIMMRQGLDILAKWCGECQLKLMLRNVD